MDSSTKLQAPAANPSQDLFWEYCKKPENILLMGHLAIAARVYEEQQPAKKGELVIYSKIFEDKPQLVIKCCDAERRDNLFAILNSILCGNISKIENNLILLKSAQPGLFGIFFYEENNHKMLCLRCGEGHQALQIKEILNLGDEARVSDEILVFSHNADFLMPHIRTRDTIFHAGAWLPHPLAQAVIDKVIRLENLRSSTRGVRPSSVRHVLAEIPLAEAALQQAREDYKAMPAPLPPPKQSFWTIPAAAGPAP